jgi:hypothetical protein
MQVMCISSAWNSASAQYLSDCLCCAFADQDSVRLLAVESCGAFAAALSKDDSSTSLLPVVQKFAQVGIL